MSKITKKILGASLSLAAFSFGYISTASAQTCTQPMTCEEMGYIDTVDRCEGDAMIKCPSDLSKVFCRNRKACTPNACSGYTLSSCPANGNCSTCDKVNDDCSSGGTKYKLDSCASGYKISGSSCIKDCTADSCSGYTLSSCPNHGSCSSCTIKNSDCTTGKTKYRLNYCTDGFYEDGDSCRQDYSVENVSIYCDQSPYYCYGTATCSCADGTSKKLTFSYSETGDFIDKTYILDEWDYDCNYFCN